MNDDSHDLELKLSSASLIMIRNNKIKIYIMDICYNAKLSIDKAPMI